MTVVATGRLVHEALAAAEEAESEGISVEVWDPRTLQPLDVDGLVASVKKTNRVVVAHEAVTRMGFGAEIAAVVGEQAFDWLDAPVERVGAKFAPLPFAPVMEEYVVPHAGRRARGDQADGRAWLARSSSAARAGHGGRHDRQVAQVRGRRGREGRAALRARHRQGDPGGRGRGFRRAAADRGRRGRGAGRRDDRLHRRGGRAGPEPSSSGNGASAAAEGRRGSTGRGLAGPAREEERERGRGAAEQIAEARQPPAQDGGRVKASPLARRIARERGIELSSLTGTGRRAGSSPRTSSGARWRAAPAAAPAPVAAPGEVERRELTSVRKTIARRLTEAWQIPVFQLQVSVDMTRANELRRAPARARRGAEGDGHRRARRRSVPPRCCVTAR